MSQSVDIDQSENVQRPTSHMLSMYWRWERVIPKEVCESLKASFEKNTECKIGFVDSVADKTKRDTDIQFLEMGHWVEGILLNYARHANSSAGWNFVITGIENIQVGRYSTDQFYDWHCDHDILDRSYENSRKLTAIIMLSDSSDYEGGKLCIEGIDDELLVNQGDVVVFPSFMRHKVNPVTNGTRMTAVGWLRGPHFT